MNQDDFRNEIERHERQRHANRIPAGLFILGVGVLLLLKSLNLIYFPAWFFTWPMILIAIGLFSGLRHGFRRGGWFILLLIGGIFLINDINPNLQLDRFIVPFIVIIIGLGFILRPRRGRCRKWRHENRWQAANSSTEPSEFRSGAANQTDFIDVNTVFGGIKKTFLSKNFKGGDIVNFIGGSEIDLTQADFNDRVRIDVTNIFGGTKLIIPPTWHVQNDVSAIFGGIDDKRAAHTMSAVPNKILILDGTCIFGGIEIRSF